MKYYFVPTSPLTNYQRSPLFEENCLAHIVIRYAKHVLKIDKKRAEFSIGFFHFVFCSHDTGVDINISIKSPNGGTREIVSCSYWHSGQYAFNPCKFESGKWDDSLEKTIDKMLIEANEAQEKEIKDYISSIKEKAAADLAEKQKFESLFQ